MSGAKTHLNELIEVNHAGTVPELYFRVSLWMAGQRRVPSVPAIRLRWGVSRSTAFRWRAAYRAAAGVLRDAQQGEG